MRTSAKTYVCLGPGMLLVQIPWRHPSVLQQWASAACGPCCWLTQDSQSTTGMCWADNVRGVCNHDPGISWTIIQTCPVTPACIFAFSLSTVMCSIVACCAAQSRVMMMMMMTPACLHATSEQNPGRHVPSPLCTMNMNMTQHARCMHTGRHPLAVHSRPGCQALPTTH
jgi:hypothetical protein